VPGQGGNRRSTSRVRMRIAVVMLTLVATLGLVTSATAAPLPGAIFTTDSTCTGVNLNIYADKGDVYLDGGPGHPGAAGLPDGSYFVQVTEPNGTVLGRSVGTAVTVSGGEFAQCYQLSAILRTASSGFVDAGYDTTSNPGGEYKVWVSTVDTFDNDSTKTDNFKVREAAGTPQQAALGVLKFYDANANGINDDGQPITGWKVRIADGVDYIRFTPVSIILDPDDYVVSEFAAVETNWVSTTPTSANVTLANGDSKTVEFGNLCLGAGGGLTLGFWSNKNGQALFGGDDLALMVSLNLRNANGTHFDPASYTAFRNWLVNASATNMAYMLSAQLAAMELNVLNGKVSGSALVYAPGASSANALGFATVDALMAEANAALGANGLTVAAGAGRLYQEALKNALDKANNNLTFVQASPCAFTFAE
jgi:hypothetical protein